MINMPLTSWARNDDCPCILTIKWFLRKTMPYGRYIKWYNHNGGVTDSVFTSSVADSGLN